MTKIQIDLPEDIDMDLRVYVVRKNHKRKTDAIIEILRKHFKTLPTPRSKGRTREEHGQKHNK